MPQPLPSPPQSTLAAENKRWQTVVKQDYFQQCNTASTVKLYKYGP